MSDYRAPLTDVRFVLEHIAQLPKLAELERFEHADPQMVYGLLEEAARFAEQAIAPTNRVGDQQHSVQDGDTVRTPDGFKEAYAQYVAAGWGSVGHEPDHGGGGFPALVANALKELITSANMAFSLGPLLTTGAVEMLQAHASEEQKAVYLPRMVTGEWAGTMNLTEPHAGSDVGALTTKAEPVEDGTYRISGQKIFITYGEHDLTDQIVHLVLARLPDAPPGTKGISVFIVPKYLVNEDGSLGERNDVKVVSLEHKLGIHASPTAVMAFGDDTGGAVGHLIGEPNKGMRYMFTMMNDARLGVGIEGLAIAERAYQQAVAYAQERTQGTAPGDERGTSSPIIRHPDVRRMLMTMKAYIEAMRALAYTNAQAIDVAKAHPDEEIRSFNQEMADLLTPITKAWCTDLGVQLTSLNVQVHGGMGYVEETGAAQHFRDARIAPIYEGTNGIQAIDLVGRKLPYRGGQFIKEVLAHTGQLAGQLEAAGEDFAPIAVQYTAAHAALASATEWIFANRESFSDVLAGATPYLDLFGHVLGGWFLGREALKARELLDSGDTSFPREYLEGKVVTARFYAENLLPKAQGLLPAVTAGADDLFAIEPAALTN